MIIRMLKNNVVIALLVLALTGVAIAQVFEQYFPKLNALGSDAGSIVSSSIQDCSRAVDHVTKSAGNVERVATAISRSGNPDLLSESAIGLIIADEIRGELVEARRLFQQGADRLELIHERIGDLNLKNSKIISSIYSYDPLLFENDLDLVGQISFHITNAVEAIPAENPENISRDEWRSLVESVTFFLYLASPATE